MADPIVDVYLQGPAGAGGGGSGDLADSAPPNIGTSSVLGVSTQAAREDHTHGHGNQTSGTLHAAASTSVAGFLSAADKTKLDGVATGAAALTSAAPANVTKDTAAVGVATAAARADHKHDVATAAAASLAPGGSNAEGSSTSLARADHTHALPAFGSTAGTFVEGDDSRLSDSRAPSGNAGGSLAGTYPNPTIAAGAITDTEVAAANKDGTSGTASMRTLGTGATQACAGDDSRLSNSRAPNGSAGGGLSGTYPNPDVAIIGTASTTAQYRGGARVSDIEAVSGSVTLAVNASQHDVDTSAARALVLPAAATIGDVHVIQDVTGNAGTNNITVTVESAGTINGAASFVIDTDWAGRAFRKLSSSAWVCAQ
jgi:hypothetical protein